MTAIFGHLTSLLKKPMPFLWSVYPWLQSEMFLSNSVDMMKNLSSAAKEGKKLQVTSQKIQIRILIKQNKITKYILYGVGTFWLELQLYPLLKFGLWFWEAHKNLSNLPHALDIYLVKFIYTEKATKFFKNLRRRFVLRSASQICGGYFVKFCSLLRISQL